MGPPSSIDRRRFVALSGTAFAVALAGCAGADGDAGDGTPTGTDASPTGGTTADDATTAGEGTTEGTETTEGDGTKADAETTEDAEVTGSGEGFLRATHASPDAPAVDVYLNDELAFEAVAYTDATPYVQLPPADYDLRLTAAGDAETVVFDETVAVASGFQTALAYGELEGASGSETAFGVDVLADQSDPPGDDESLVRAFHGTPDASAVDVSAEERDGALFEGVAFGTVTDYASLPTGSYTLEIRLEADEGADEEVTTVDATLEGGSAYTALAVGYLEPSGDQSGFDVVTLADSEDRLGT